jgi:hypothetical protein
MFLGVTTLRTFPHVEPSSPQCNEGIPEDDVITAQCSFLDNHRSCQQHWATWERSPQSFVFMNSSCNKLTPPFWETGSTSPPGTGTPPFRKLHYKANNPDHASFSRTRLHCSLFAQDTTPSPTRLHQLLATNRAGLHDLLGWRNFGEEPPPLPPLPRHWKPTENASHKTSGPLMSSPTPTRQPTLPCVHNQRHRLRCQRWILQEQLLHLLLRSGRHHQSLQVQGVNRAPGSPRDHRAAEENGHLVSYPLLSFVDSMMDITRDTSPLDWTVKALSSRHHPPRIQEPGKPAMISSSTSGQAQGAPPSPSPGTGSRPSGR